MKKNFLYWALCTIILGAFVCSCDESEDDYVELSQKKITFNEEGGSETVTLKANAEWTITEKPDWCTVTPVNATRSTDIILSAADNEGEQREGIIKVRRGLAEEIITLIQKRKKSPITFDKKELSFPNEGGQEKIKITAKGEW